MTQSKVLTIIKKNKNEDLTKKKNKIILLAIFISLGFVILVGLFISGNKTEETKKDNQTSASASVEEDTSKKMKKKLKKMKKNMTCFQKKQIQ